VNNFDTKIEILIILQKAVLVVIILCCIGGGISIVLDTSIPNQLAIWPFVLAIVELDLQYVKNELRKRMK